MNGRTRNCRWTGFAVAVLLATLNLSASTIDPVTAQDDTAVRTTSVMAFEASGAKRTAIDEIVVEAGRATTLRGFPEERLYYVLDGRGVISIYEEYPNGDAYDLRQDLAVYMTPQIKHDIVNTGATPLRLVVFRVTGGLAPDGELTWSAVTQRGVTVANPAVGAGVAVTKVFDEGSNPSKEEGQHLRIHDIMLRRPQKFSNAEVLTIAPGRSTRLHTHHDSDETLYILMGEGAFVWNDKRIAFKAGSTISYPVGVSRRVENTGKYPLSYICISSFVE
jgi:mannose-6-phosphate isomerase-like protein (cupin superfamily)